MTARTVKAAKMHIDDGRSDFVGRVLIFVKIVGKYGNK
jgi:hypothetical protein